jgi:ribonuclease BN (tRNA processing enzyme)
MVRGEVTVEFVGSGDAFGSGGRLQTCFHVRSNSTQGLIDCGATALSGLKRARNDTAAIDVILVSHLHGDHFAGLPFFILDAHFAKRERPLEILGPAGISTRTNDAIELMFPGAATMRTPFQIKYSEFRDREEMRVGSFKITPYTVSHPSGAPAYALRVELDGIVIAYSGDTEWTDALLEVSKDSDLFICEAYRYERKVRFHLDYATVRTHLEALSCRRIILTHFSDDILKRLSDVAIECANDGQVVQLASRTPRTTSN